ncbi:MAG: hypothetical protein AABY14_03960, partial [Nanoarchaeota archaeon]
KFGEIERYLFLVLLVYVLLLLLNHKQMRKSFESKSIGELCRQLNALCYTTMLENVKHFDNQYLQEFALDLASAL